MKAKTPTDCYLEVGLSSVTRFSSEARLSILPANPKIAIVGDGPAELMAALLGTLTEDISARNLDRVGLMLLRFSEEERRR